MEKDNLRLLVFDNAKELGEKVVKHLKKWYPNAEEYVIPCLYSRFTNGEGKAKILKTVRSKNLFLLSDVGNYHVTYQMHGATHEMSPDEHFQDIKRVVSAASGHAEKMTLLMPLLYQARQHKRKGRESLDCAIALQELEQIGIDSIVTFDAHDPNISNAIPLLPFSNFYPTDMILADLLREEQGDLEDILVISPDMGAMERARYYAEMLGSDVGVFYKRRDLSQVVNGKNPIIEHVYLGIDVKDKTVLVVDDMIASGQSMIDVAKQVQEQGAKKVYLIATFALFTEGIDCFVKAYEQGLFTRLYATNLSYVPESVKKLAFYHEVDCSYQIAEIIHTLHQEESIEPLVHSNEQMLALLKEVSSR